MRGFRVRHRHVVVLGAITALIATGLWVQLGGATTTSTNPDTIQYVQTTGSSGTFIKYVPGDGSTPTNQSVTSGGGCATPKPKGAPILGFSAHYYQNGYTGGTVTDAVVGAYKARTGVCQLPQAWSIEVKEGLDFSVGSNTLVAGRLFSRAQIQIEREDKYVVTDPPVTGQLVMSLAGNAVGSPVPFSVPAANTTTPITADTGTVVAGFDKVEVRVLTPATGSISVVGPTSTFTLESTICPDHSITTSSNDVTATLTVVDGSWCKSYALFGADSTDKSVTFLSSQLPGAHMTAAFDWGYFPYCRADGVSDTVPACPPTQVDFGDGVFHTETYCAAADPNPGTAPQWTPPPWCATTRHVDYVLDPGGSGATVAHITETWDGYGDIIWRH
jgi:hypothetical protein